MPFDNKYKNGEAIRDERIKANLSMQKFAALVGVHSRTVSRWENEGVTPRTAVLEKITRVFSKETPTNTQDQSIQGKTIDMVVLKFASQLDAEALSIGALLYLQEVFESFRAHDISFSLNIVQALLETRSYREPHKPPD